MLSARLSTPALYLSGLKESAEFLKGILPWSPDTVVILGSGLGSFADCLEGTTRVPYQSIPNFRHSTVPGHRGNLVFGTLGSKRVAVLEGRVHGYEGHSGAEIAFNLRALLLCHAHTVVVTNAAGSINTTMKPGDIVAITNHISLFADDPMRGFNDELLGPRFYDQTHPYSRALIAHAQRHAEQRGVELKHGTYVLVPGPRFESAADISWLRAMECDLVGMSTVPEVLAARAMRHIDGGKISVLGFSLVTNLAAGTSDEPLDHKHVLEEGKSGGARLAQFLSTLVPELTRDPADCPS